MGNSQSEEAYNQQIIKEILDLPGRIENLSVCAQKLRAASKDKLLEQAILYSDKEIQAIQNSLDRIKEALELNDLEMNDTGPGKITNVNYATVQQNIYDQKKLLK